MGTRRFFFVAPQASNCVAGDTPELSVIYDDGEFAPPSERLKGLLSNTSITVSADGISWRPWTQWTSETVDPGYSVYRNPINTSEIVVTARQVAR